MHGLKLSLEIEGEDQRATKLGRSIFQHLKDNFGTLPFELQVSAASMAGQHFERATYINEGKPS